MTTAAAPVPQIGPDSVLELAELVVRAEGDDFVVGRMDTGEFVLLPPIGARAVTLFGTAMSIDAVAVAIADEFGDDFDLVDFARDLVELDFVRRIDGTEVGTAPPAPPVSLPGLQARHVAWLFGRTAMVVYLVVVLSGLSAPWWHRIAVPSYQALLFSSSTSLVIVASTAIFLGIVALHEFAHLVAARSLGVPGRISLGTRLYALVAQTNITGMWALSRRQRLRGYLAGPLCDLGLLSVTLLVLGTGLLPAAARHVLSSVIVLLLVGLASQTQLFLRTDLYFVISDLLSCRNLYQDAMDYLGSVLSRLRHPGAGRIPLATSAPREYRIVRAYAWLMLAGSAIALTVFATLLLPALALLLVDAGRHVVAGIADQRWGLAADGVLTLIIEGGFQVLFVVTFLRTHRHWFRRRVTAD